MTKLQILIPQYNETEEQIKPLLDSIQIQQNINLKENIEVFIGNDGSETKLSTDFLKQYTYRIQYHFFEHGRLAATRKKLFDLATAEYIMYCDADDMFLSNFALHIIFTYMEKGFDSLFCEFVSEIKIDDKIIYRLSNLNPIFVHGKVYRRQFLLDNNIIWHEELHEHQDHPYNILAHICSKNHQVCKTPLYIWRHNSESVSRKNGRLHSAKTWTHLIDASSCLIQDCMERGYGEHARYQSFFCLYSTYMQMQEAIWKEEGMEDYKIAIYKRVNQFYKQFKLLLDSVQPEMKEKIIENQIRLAKERNLSLENALPFEEWFKNILILFK